MPLQATTEPHSMRGLTHTWIFVVESLNSVMSLGNVSQLYFKLIAIILNNNKNNGRIQYIVR